MEKSQSPQLDSDGFVHADDIYLGNYFLVRFSNLYGSVGKQYRKVALLWNGKEGRHTDREHNEWHQIHSKEFVIDNPQLNTKEFWEAAANYFNQLYSLSRQTRIGYLMPVASYVKLMQVGESLAYMSFGVRGGAAVYALSYPHALCGLAASVGFNRVSWSEKGATTLPQTPNYNKVYAVVEDTNGR